MSLSTSLSNALSGLTAVGRMAETVSSNIANSMTEGYGRREVELSQRVIAGSGAGVRVSAIVRHVDPVLLADRRMADAELAHHDARAGFLAQIEGAIGSPDQPGSLTARIAALGASLIEAASRPDSEARLQAVVSDAGAVTERMNAISDRIQDQRLQAERGIDQAVGQINTALEQIASLNGKIMRLSAASHDAAALLDQRQRLIDGIAELIPVREMPREDGTVALFTPGGAIMLDATPAKLGFDAAGTITPHMTLSGGTLSGLTINGRPVSTDATSGPIAGGRLAALFDVRDVQAPAVQARLDAAARDLIERFQSPAVDPTLAPGDPGLFTDAGAAFAAADEVGLAERISLNALVDPAAGGALWRLQSGLNAAAPLEPGDSTLLNALGDALTASRVPATGGYVTAHSAVGVASDLLSGVSVDLAAAETRQSYARAQSKTLTEAELRAGVDTDQEMQKLLMVEQAFAANARVISTIDELIQTLLRI